jgi:hypothetical protein
MHTLVEIDAQIEALEAELAQLRRQRNALMPVQRLPPEIIVQIMALLQLHV